MKNMELFINLRDASGAETIWTCCVVCLAHLAALSHQMSQTDLASSVPVNDLYDVALGKLGSLSLYVRIEVYSPLDLLLGVRILRWFVAPCEVRRLPAKLFHAIRFLGKGH